MNRIGDKSRHGYVYDTIDGLSGGQTPVWLMRQAGRYLPEYRELRTKAETFIDFCFTPKLVVEATLQPIRRFEFDAAIIFSDILIVPHCLGQQVSFITGKGPILEPIIRANEPLNIADNIEIEALGPIVDAIAEVRAKLSPGTSLIGFCGAPWTVASYMIAGHSTPDQAPARLFAYANPERFEALINRLTEASVSFLDQQINAGVNIVQIFDSWAGVLPTSEFERWCLGPVARLTQEIRNRHPDVKIIVFSRGVGWKLAQIAALKSIDCVGLDTTVDLDWVVDTIPANCAVQGNLDPLALLAGGAALDRSVDNICEILEGRKFVFNLGHGILPQTPIENVHRLVKRIRI